MSALLGPGLTKEALQMLLYYSTVEVDMGYVSNIHYSTRDEAIYSTV